MTGLRHVRIAPGEGFVDACARALVDTCADRDLTRWRVVVPNLMIAPDIKRALVEAAGHALLLPPVETLQVHLRPWVEGFAPMPDHRRRFALYQQLRERRWFAQGDLWTLCAEFIALFDELTEQGAHLPASEEALSAQLAAAYEAREDAALRFEARVVHALWLAETTGAPSVTAARLLAAAQWTRSAPNPLLVIAEGPLPRPWHEWLAAHAEQVPVILCEADRRVGGGPMLDWLNAAWPHDAADDMPLKARVAGLPAPAAIDGRVTLLCAESLEQEAHAVVDRVKSALVAGVESIALVAVDRLVARRARALLERDRILVADESGWKLSTTRAAALIDAIFRTLAGNAYHRDLLDLAKSPYVLADIAPAARDEAILALEAAISGANFVAGFEQLGCLKQAVPDVDTFIDRLKAARDAFGHSAAAPSAWLSRLLATLEALGAMTPLADDAAGQVLIEWIEGRRDELRAERCELSFDEWRAWFERGMDEALFRDRSIRSPVVMTHLPACRLRHFELAIVIGADGEQLKAESQRPVFAHEGVRQDLGLPGVGASIRRLRDDLVNLLAGCRQVTFTWQRLKAGEPNALASDLDLLDLAHTLGTGRGLVVPAAAVPMPRVVHEGTPVPAPEVPKALRPASVTAYGYESLVRCPYQYFLRFMLGIDEAEAVQEALEKREYGQFVHDVLDRFHQAYPVVSGQDVAGMLAALEAISRQVFEAMGAQSFFEGAWLMRWQAHLQDYLAWQQRRESDGWRYAVGEHAVKRPLPLADGDQIMLKGRIDRMDRRDDDVAVLDYKTRDIDQLKRQAKDPEDGQLAVYAALVGPSVTEAAYVALDGDTIDQAQVDAPQMHAEAHVTRLIDLFTRIGAGTPMPANGSGRSCDWCAVRGVCRKDYHDEH